ncbi:MAG: sugar transferase [Henriciella sp.]|uniref:sugar transferase n=1 Tax=Henriciella sp. TaxID=1968823 RepID=UPI003C757051
MTDLISELEGSFVKSTAKFDDGDNFMIDGTSPRKRRSPITTITTRLYERFGKRVLDLFLLLIALPVVLPVVLIIGLLVRSDGHTALFHQDRVGKGGTLFRVWKFRTMVPDAETELSKYLAENPQAAEEWHKYQKLRDDPRITPLGRFLRASSLDELPQLWNVAVGDMSLVGPRPMLPSQVSLYPGSHYSLMRPGITGTWQVSDRNDSSFAVRGRFDTEYWADLSLKADLIVLWKTIFAVLSCSGR